MEARMQEAEVTKMAAVVVGEGDPEIVELEARIRAAQLAADVQALDELIDEGLLFTGPDGQLATKSQDLEAYRTGLVRFQSHEPEELRIRRVGSDVAVTALRARLEALVAGVSVRGTCRYTRVWARRDGTWRVVAGQVAEVPGVDKTGRGDSG